MYYAVHVSVIGKHMKLASFIGRLFTSYLFVVSAALAVGLLFADRIAVLTQFTTFFLQAIFFLSSLKMETRKILKDMRDVGLVIVVNAFMLIILPIAVFFVAKTVAPSLAVPLLLLAAMPSGMTTPLLAEVVGGRQSLALVLTVSSSLLAPLTIPLVIDIFASTAVDVDVYGMFVKLVLVIVVPFVIAQMFRALLFRQIAATQSAYKPLSIGILGLLIAGAVAKQATVILGNLNGTMLAQLGALSLFLIALLAGGYFLAHRKSRTDRLTVAVSVTFMNFTLAIYLADAFFADPNVLLASVLVIFPWVLLLIPFKYVVTRRR